MALLRRAPACLLASITLLVHSPVLAAPPPNQPAPPVEPEPVEPEPVPDPVIEPEPEPISEEPALPSWDAPLPSYEQVPEAAPFEVFDTEEELPPDGMGSTVTGSMLLGGGLFLTASSAALIVYADWNERSVWILGATFGSIAIVGGVVLLISGAVKRRDYEPWKLQHNPPRRGTGLLAGGSLALSAGVLGMLLGGISLTLEGADDPPYGAVLLSIGTLSVVSGVAMLVVGAKQRKAFEQWDRNRVTPSFGLVGQGHTRVAGATFGIAGRF